MQAAGRAAVLFLTGGSLVLACGSSQENDEIAPSCNGVSPANLTYEQTPAGQCPTTPTLLTGKATVGTPCSQATDCAPLCCQCPGTSGGADVAQCSGGNCLDGATTCCLYALQCAQ